jgi:hypothetical protein
MTPELVAETLQNSVRVPMSAKTSGKVGAPTTPEEVVNGLKSDITPGTRFNDHHPDYLLFFISITTNILDHIIFTCHRRFLKFLVRLGSRGVKQREATKSAVIGVTHKLRLAMLDLKKLLVAQGRIPDEDLTCFFSLHEILQLIRRPCPAYVQK